MAIPILRLVGNQNNYYAIQIYKPEDDSWEKIGRWYAFSGVAIAFAQQIFDAAENAERESNWSVIETWTGGTTE